MQVAALAQACSLTERVKYILLDCTDQKPMETPDRDRVLLSGSGFPSSSILNVCALETQPTPCSAPRYWQCLCSEEEMLPFLSRRKTLLFKILPLWGLLIYCIQKKFICM